MDPLYIYAGLAAAMILLGSIIVPKLSRKPAPITSEDLRRAEVDATRIRLFEMRMKQEDVNAEVTKLSGRLVRLLNEREPALTERARHYDELPGGMAEAS